ncbi:hypothetical protein GCM10025876_41370 [Demequina litorisediminis]|uniref:Uncharacterized protein n=1 Tax=Demequina litorisediminis TaxID=1849022 RepID=A0ABQ6IJ96_9MICO|nr:hypothetical protein GCM10025876_40080 [Demequina litorisediminis]GMA37863.1 hypothetical protein GCM10025876_40670 [Demequina litorisediminis]GMA37933.1 hypothetical protein GCM10025876_41370 [Demequina litorisediminis]
MLVGAAAVTATPQPAQAYETTNGWTNGSGQQRGSGAGVVLSEFWSYGDSAAWRQKWLGGLNPNVVGNRPSGTTGKVWCIEAGADLETGASYSWSSNRLGAAALPAVAWQ